MSNASTSAEARLQEACLRAMNASRFTSERRREWYVWAARHRPCPQCKMGKDLHCVHLGKLRNNIHEGIKWPHAERVDWTRMYNGLITRGYIED